MCSFFENSSLDLTARGLAAWQTAHSSQISEEYFPGQAGGPAEGFHGSAFNLRNRCRNLGHMGGLAPLPSMGHGGKARAIRLQHEFPQWGCRNCLAKCVS